MYLLEYSEEYYDWFSMVIGREGHVGNFQFERMI